MQSRTTISVALCTCNGASFIEEQVDSICRQTLPANEIVLHDDASTDDTLYRARQAWQRCRDHGLAVPAWRETVHTQRRGVAANFSGALAKCTGDLIALCDQDDRWHPQRLAMAVGLLQSRPDVLLLHANADLVDGEGQALAMDLFTALEVSPLELRALEQGRALEVLLDRNLATGATMMIRRELLQLALPVPTHWLHDEWLAVLAGSLGRLMVTRAKLLDYRQHGSNQVGARQEGWLEALRRLTSPRGDFLSHRLVRARQLQQALQLIGPGVTNATLEMVADKVAHHAIRAALPSSRLLRVMPVWREWKTGRYRRFGRGIRGILKDLLEAP